MGNYASSFRLPCFPPRKKCKVIIHGLDAAGKTTVLYKLKLAHQEVVTTIPTIGFNVEQLDIQGYEFTAWDVGGRDKIRPLWRHYYPGTDALVFVVDSNDSERLDEARDELHRALEEEELQGKPVLIYCNKQDLPNAMSPLALSEALQLDPYRRMREILCIGSVANTGKGLQEGLEVLARVLDASREKGNPGKTESKEESPVEKHDTELDFDPVGFNRTLQRFVPIKTGTQCPFAKSAKLWGGRPVAREGASLEDQARMNANALTEFTRRSNNGENLDGFCIELDDVAAREGGPKELGHSVYRMLAALADEDPSGENVMKVRYIGSRGWRYRFNKTDFFVTTFSPCYPSTSSRYSFGSNHAFVLLQPERSFERHNLPDDTPTTHWEDPKTIRDKTRVAFQKAGRGYHIPTTTKYPMAEHIVKPLKDDGKSVVNWWKTASLPARRERV